MAKTAAVPPARALKELATSTATTRPNGSGPDTLPMASTADATKASWARTNATMTQSQLAPSTVSNDWDTSMRTPMRAQPPMSVPTTMISVGQLTRRGSTSFGTLIDLAWAARCRTSSRSPRWLRRVRPRMGSRAARCRCWRAPASTSASRARAAE